MRKQGRNHVDTEEGKVVCVLEFDFGALGVNSLGVRVKRCCQLHPGVAWETPGASGVSLSGVAGSISALRFSSPLM